MLKEGDPVPAFATQDQHSTPVTLKDLKGKKIILYFYPKDNTPGCTLEACGFRDAYDKFQKKGVEIFGISRDTAKKHQNFIAKHQLPFSLLADTESSICDAFDVIKEKSMFGKKYWGIERSTFLINADGIVEKVWPKVKIAGHVEEVLQALDL